MKRFLLSFFSVLMIFQLISTSYISGNALRETKNSEIIAEGVTYEKLTLLRGSGFVDIHVLVIDRDNPYIDLEILRSTEQFGLKHTLTALADTTKGVVGAINGSFYNTQYIRTDSIGTEYNEGYVSTESYYNIGFQGAASLIDTGNQMMIDLFSTAVSLDGPDGFKLRVAGINRLTNMDQPVLFNDAIGKSTEVLVRSHDRYKIILDEGIVSGIVGPKEHVPMQPGRYVLVLPPIEVDDHVDGQMDPEVELQPSVLDNYPIGASFSIKIVESLPTENLKMIFSGGGMILEAGLLVPPNGMVPGPNARHPRSAVGLTGDDRYLIAMVVDGRGSSIGATHAEMADYLRRYDVTEAMHLDGGGSSMMGAVSPYNSNISIVNAPSDGQQRAIVNGLGFVSSAPKDGAIHLKLIPNRTQGLVGTEFRFTLMAHDGHYNPIIINPKDVAFMTQGLSGSMQQDRFVATNAGEGKVTVFYREAVATVDIQVYDVLYDLKASPAVLNLTNSQTGSFSLSGTSVGGLNIAVPRTMVTYTLSDSTLGHFEQGTFIPSGKEGTSKVTITGGGRSTTTYVTVNQTKQASQLLFDYQDFLSDPLRGMPKEADFHLSVFGATGGKNRLLDQVVMNKVYQEMSKSDLAYFTGFSDLDIKKVNTQTRVWKDAYTVVDYDAVRVIELATSKGGLLVTDLTQWTKLEQDLEATTQNNIILVANKDPRTGFSSQREGDWLHEALSDFANKNPEKALFYINASGTRFDVSFVDGVRYMTLNGLWYRVQDQKLNLNDTFYIVDFYVKDQVLSYEIRNLYPMIEVK